MKFTPWVLFALASSAVSLVACSSDPTLDDPGATPDADQDNPDGGDGDSGDGDSGDGDSADSGDGDSGDSGDGDGTGPGDIDFDGDVGAPTDPDPSEDMETDEPEVCDGIDNDGDGQIDNVDAGGDGICDCLNIGTIGRIGPWSNGGDIFKEWLDERSPMPAFEIGDQELTEELLTGLNVIVVLRADTSPLGQDDSPAHHEFSEGEVAALESWVRAGGGLMTTIGYQSNESAEVQNVNRLLAPLGGGYDAEHTDLDSGFLDVWTEDHPIANGVSRINIENGVRPLSDSGAIVAWGEQDKAGIVAHEPGDGRIIVFGDEWVTYDSEWVDTEEQQVELLWLNMIKWMSPPKSCQVEIPPELIVR